MDQQQDLDKKLKLQIEGGFIDGFYKQEYKCGHGTSLGKMDVPVLPDCPECFKDGKLIKPVAEFNLHMRCTFSNGILFQQFVCDHQKPIGESYIKLPRACKECFGGMYQEAKPEFVDAPAQELEIPKLPPEAYRRQVDAGSVESYVLRGHQPIFIIDRIQYPEAGTDHAQGVFIYHKDSLFPVKGFPDPETVLANNFAKRVFIQQIKWIKSNPLLAVSMIRTKNIERWLESYCKIADATLQPYFLKEEWYSVPCMWIKKFVFVFLTNIGISAKVSEQFARTFAHLIEFDDAYRYRIEDLALETTTEKLHDNPARELNRLLNIFAEREVGFQNRAGKMVIRKELIEKFNNVVVMLTRAFTIPRFKKAFRKGLKSIDFSKIQMDEADRYHTLRQYSYNFGGRTVEDRGAEYLKMHNGKLPQPMIINL